MELTFYEAREEKLFVGEMTKFPFPAHVHEVAEIVALSAGRVTMMIDGKTRELTPGDLALIFPLVPHSYEKLSEDSSGLAVILPPDTIAEYANTFHTLIPDEPVLRAEEVSPEAREAVSRLRELGEEGPLHLTVAYLHLLLAATLHGIGYHSVFDYSERSLGYRIIHYISDHACEDITLESAARALGISASHLSHFFSRQMHVNFRRFLNALRIDKARMMARNPSMTLNMICDACGYANMRTFRRAFLQETGFLPSEYLQQLRRRIDGNYKTEGMEESQ